MDIQIDRTRSEPDRPISISSIARPLELAPAEARSLAPISWKGVLAGVLVALLTHLTLISLGIALGGSSLRAIIEGSAPLASMGASSAFWLILSVTLSLYMGSYVGARLSGAISARVGQLQGVVISALFFGLTLIQIGSTLGLVSRSLGEIGKSPMVQDAIRSSLGKNPLKSLPIKTIGETTVSVVSTGGWTLFSGLILGTLFSFMGGGAGVSAHFDRSSSFKNSPRKETKSAA